ncbi:MAG: extracellular solute-binding protein [Candidatus Colwellbacteria bacterium]|nr:extracellular solute-binding protein [Candidatus Colwellbacteria bacterium]
MTFTKQQLIFLGAAGVIIIVFLVILFAGGRKSTEKINLTVWGIDDGSAWDYPIFSYQKLHPNVRIKYTELKPETYEEDLINALAAGKGPDIFMLNNRWLVKHADKITPLPAEKMSANAFKGLFPQVAEYDLLSNEGQIYGLPLSVDTLALFYNQDIFDRSGVALPPKTWDEFLAVIPKVRKVDTSGNLTLSAAALGGQSENIENAADVLALLMLQTGALTPDKYPSETVDSKAGENALDFYIRFANPQSQSYAWNNSFAPSFDSFAEGKTAIVFAYASNIPEIKAKNPFLKFAVVPAPQANPDEPVNATHYWALTVSNKAGNPETAWDFIIFATTDKDAATSYITSTARPPALSFLINDYLNNADLGVFARQALTARSFYQADDTAVRELFDKAIKKAASGMSVREVISEIEADFNALERKQ